MSSDGTKVTGRKPRTKKDHSAAPQAAQPSDHAVIEAERSGNWVPAEELREAALAALEDGPGVTIDLGKVDHLDASALQILLAIEAEQKKRGRQLTLLNASPDLRQWFEYSGTREQLFPAGAER